MIIKTRVFDLINGSLPHSKYRNLSELAAAMGLSISQVYRVREGKRCINEKFIIGAKKAFPACRLDELFYFSPDYTIEIVKRTKVAERHDKTESESLTL